MAETSDLIKQLQRLQNTYDAYFQNLSKGEPAAPELPEFTIQELGDAINNQFPADMDVSPDDDMNSALDALKAGFAYIKLNKLLPAWANGVKLTAIEDIQTDDEEDSEDLED